MKASKRGLDLIKRFEGLKLKPYLCSAQVPTIGFGSTFYPNGQKVKLTDPIITESYAESLLISTVKSFETKLNPLLVGVKPTQNQYDALMSFVFNLGVGALAKSTLLKKIKINPNDPSIKVEFMKWVNSNGKQLQGLVNRRKAESDLYFM